MAPKSAATKSSLLLGYEVGSGKPIEIPIRNLVVTGQTQEAGKTTTLEALISRANMPAVAFVTKRGEGSFAQANRIPPYMRERADWHFVRSLLEATMRERMKFETSWIMRASKGATTLAQVQRNVAMLGTDADVRVAAKIGVTANTVSIKRWKLGIPPYYPEADNRGPVHAVPRDRIHESVVRRAKRLGLTDKQIEYLFSREKIKISLRISPKKIISIMTKIGMSGADLGRASDLSADDISRIISGGDPLPIAKKIAKALKCSVAKICG
jgi:hypothetical protein